MNAEILEKIYKEIIEIINKYELNSIESLGVLEMTKFLLSNESHENAKKG